MERAITFSVIKMAMAFIMAALVAMALVPSPAHAVSKTVAYQGFTTNTKAIEKKAATVKKGTTKLTLEKGQGYVRFKSPKAKTYSFTFSNVKSSKTSRIYVEILTPYADDKNYSFLTDVKTKGGVDNVLWLSVRGAKLPHVKSVVDKPISKRTGKLKLKKGETLYFYINSVGKTSTTLKIS